MHCVSYRFANNVAHYKPDSRPDYVTDVYANNVAKHEPDYVADAGTNLVTNQEPNAVANDVANRLTNDVANNVAYALANDVTHTATNDVSDLVTHPCMFKFRSTLHSNRGSESLQPSSPPGHDHWEESFDCVQERRVSHEHRGRISRAVVVGCDLQLCSV